MWLSSIGVPPAARMPSLTLAASTRWFEVAGHRLDPPVRDADDRLAQGIVVEADPLEIGACGGTLRALGDLPACSCRRSTFSVLLIALNATPSGRRDAAA